MFTDRNWPELKRQRNQTRISVKIPNAVLYYITKQKKQISKLHGFPKNLVFI
jgi:hypothetical protein